jgi:hypothetical protein
MGDDIAWGERLRTVNTWITYGSTAGKVEWVRFAWPLILVVAALLPDRTAHPLPPAWRVGLPLIWGGMVIGALFVSGAYREANLKMLLPAQIAAALLIGRGVRRLWSGALVTPEGFARPSRKIRYSRRIVAAVGVILLITGQLNALDALYRDPAYARDDYRAIAARIMSDTRPGDAIILDAPNQAEVFSYYYDGDAPIYELPRGLGGDDAATRAEVEAVIARHTRIFVLFWGEAERDPHRVVQATLDERAFPVASEWVGDVRLAQYAVLAEAPAEPAHATDARFGESIRLLGYALSMDSARPGDVIGVTLFWQTERPLDRRYKVTVQLLAPDGALIAQHDAEPNNNRVLTTDWLPGETVIDPHGLVIPPDLPAGRITIIVGMYDIDAPMQRLAVVQHGAPGGDALVLEMFRVE